jgi:hypothetical protein
MRRDTSSHMAYAVAQSVCHTFCSFLTDMAWSYRFSMEFMISKQDLAAALKEVTRGYKRGSGGAELTTDGSELTIKGPRRSVRISVEVLESGRESVSISKLFWLKRNVQAYSEGSVRISIRDGTFD